MKGQEVYAAWFRRGGALAAETFRAADGEEAQRIANGTYRTGSFGPLAEVIGWALEAPESTDWAMVRALPLTDGEVAALGKLRVSGQPDRRYVLIVNDHARGDALTLTASEFPLRVAREAWRDFGDPEGKPDTLGECIADVVRDCEAGVWYSIPLGNVWGAVFAADALPDLDHLADGLKCSVPALSAKLRAEGIGDGFVACGRCGQPGCDPTLERRPGEGVICDDCRDGDDR
jgi:hypothetical protein